MAPAQRRHALRALPVMLAWIALAAIQTACKKSDPSREPGEPEVARPASQIQAESKDSGTLALVSASGRCGECHGKMESEWKGSAHARAGQTAIYRAMRSRAEPASCDRCHAPLTALIDPSEPAAQEGVTCDVCHTIAAVTAKASGAGFELRAYDNVKYGPLCDAKDHYFHKMGCSTLHTESTFCAGCHLLYVTTRRGESLPVFTEYEEWREGPYRSMGVDCQGCHMPEAPAEVAVGSPKRVAVAHHGFLGREGTLRREAIQLRVVVARQEGKLHVEVALHNNGAGHKVPTGMPGKRLVLRVRALDESGSVFSRLEQSYARILVDERNAEAPFYAAARLSLDNRLGPDERRNETFDLEAPFAGRLQVELIWKEIDDSVAAALGVPLPREQLLREISVAFSAPSARKAKRPLPKVVEVK